MSELKLNKPLKRKLIIRIIAGTIGVFLIVFLITFLTLLAKGYTFMNAVEHDSDDVVFSINDYYVVAQKNNSYWYETDKGVEAYMENTSVEIEESRIKKTIHNDNIITRFNVYDRCMFMTREYRNVLPNYYICNEDESIIYGYLDVAKGNGKTLNYFFAKVGAFYNSTSEAEALDYITNDFKLSINDKEITLKNGCYFKSKIDLTADDNYLYINDEKCYIKPMKQVFTLGS